MKTIILSLSALLTAGIASAQSYPKQPDPSVVTYIEYKKVAKEETNSEAKAEATEVNQTEQDGQTEATTQPAVSVNATAVSENRKNTNARREE